MYVIWYNSKIINLYFNCKEEASTSVVSFYMCVALPVLAETCHRECDEYMNTQQSYIVLYSAENQWTNID
jgi:hypothetical protein